MILYIITRTTAALWKCIAKCGHIDTGHEKVKIPFAVSTFVSLSCFIQFYTRTQTHTHSAGYLAHWSVVTRKHRGIIPASYLFGFPPTSATMKRHLWRQTQRGYQRVILMLAELDAWKGKSCFLLSRCPDISQGERGSTCHMEYDLLWSIVNLCPNSLNSILLIFPKILIKLFKGLKKSDSRFPSPDPDQILPLSVFVLIF